MQTMNLLNQALNSTPIVYVTPDIERAMGLPLNTEGYIIISNANEFAKEQTKKKNKIILISAEKKNGYPTVTPRRLVTIKSIRKSI
jgi:hypothetical protein